MDNPAVGGAFGAAGGTAIIAAHVGAGTGLYNGLSAQPAFLLVTSPPISGIIGTALMASAVSACAAIFLVLELDHPFSGLIGISSEPMLNALHQLAK